MQHHVPIICQHVICVKMIIPYETGERQPSIEMLLALSKFFNVSVDYLIGNPETAAPFFSDAEIELVMAAREADERAREDALTLLRRHSAKRRELVK